MASFLTNLWNSIFTPGPTPTLLIATNATFAALQLLLFVLLVATYSVHFVVLSGLTAGLWWAINWFAGELRAAQEKEEEARRIRGARMEKEKEKAGSEGEGMDSGDDTEVDTEVEEKSKSKPVAGAGPAGAAQGAGLQEKPVPKPEKQIEERKKSPTPMQSSAGPAGASTTGASTNLEPLVVDDALKKRRSVGDSTGELSTDSEWEKVSEEGER